MRNSASSFAVALSGGGSRASLYCMGALIALTDRGLNKKISQISSVSGGSITNGFLAQRCDLSEVDADQLDDIASDFVGRVRKGTITRSVILAYALFAVLLAGGVTALLSEVLGIPAAALLGLFAVAVALLAIGKVVDLLLHRRFFSDSPRKTVADLDRSVEHIFCATDLKAGQPVYLSTWSGGVWWRRHATDLKGEGGSAGNLRIAEVVRSSAAFPGIPPRRFHLQATGPEEKMVSCFLADGGIWNNLGTQALLEDKYFHGAVHPLPGPLFKLEEMAYCQPPEVLRDLKQPFLCINASAETTDAPSWLLATPLIASAFGLVRSMQVLATNTVGPRVTAMHEALAMAAGDHEPVDQVVLMADIVNGLSLGLDSAELLTSVCAIAGELEEAIDKRIRAIIETPLDLTPPQSKLPPWHRDACSWMLDVADDTHARLRLIGTDGLFKALSRRRTPLLSTRYAKHPTSLGRVERQACFDLLLAGYVGAYLWSLSIESPSPDPNDSARWLFPDAEKVHSRLAAIAGLEARRS